MSTSIPLGIGCCSKDRALGLGHTRPRWSSSMVASPSQFLGLEACALEEQAFVLVRPWSCFEDHGGDVLGMVGAQLCTRIPRTC